MAERGKPKGNDEFSWLLHSRILTPTLWETYMFWMWIHVRIIISGLDQSVARLFYKTPGRRFRPQWFFSAFFFFFFFSSSSSSSFFLLSFYIIAKWIIKCSLLETIIYLSRMKSCLWGWSCYHCSLAQRHISHRIHMFLATLSIICKCGISGIGCVSIWCASGRGFLFQASATYRCL